MICVMVFSYIHTHFEFLNLALKSLNSADRHSGLNRVDAD